MFVCPTCGTGFGSPGFCTEDGTALDDASADPLLGQSVGSYRLARLLGQGGMGSVYLGVHAGIGSRVAVKVLSPAASSEPSLVARFFAEARAVNVIRHESIVNVLDLATLPDGRPYITMEYLEGAPLSEHFRVSRPFPLDQLARIGLEVLGALAAAHALGITHRDLKPDNIFITTLGRVKVLDFGIAKLRPEHGGRDASTRAGALLGTPQYMSPEQALGQFVDPRSDIYSLGVILFEGATGRAPFAADSLFELLRQHIETIPPPARSERGDLPAAFESVIARMLDKERGRRFQTAEECAVALEAASRGLPQSRLTSLPPVAGSERSYATTAPSPGILPPTVGATALTVAGTTHAPRSSMGLWLGLVAVALVAVTLVIGGAALFVGTGLMRGQTPIATSATGTATATPTVIDVPPNAPPQAPAGGKRLDLQALFTKATQDAKKEYADAGLVGMSASGVARDGTVDVSDPKRAVSFMFRSPSTTDERCLVNVSVSLWGSFANKLKDAMYECKQPILAAPRCTVRSVLAEVPASKSIHTLTLQNQTGVWQWVVMTDGGRSLQIKPDDC